MCNFRKQALPITTRASGLAGRRLMSQVILAVFRLSVIGNSPWKVRTLQLDAAPGAGLWKLAPLRRFTALVLMLRDAGQLNLDDPIEKYLPEFKIKATVNLIHAWQHPDGNLLLQRSWLAGGY
jgi:hypothetical protein